jgi:hypothetical protein
MLRPQDILVVLKLTVAPHKKSYQQLGSELGLSASQTHAAVKRAVTSRLLQKNGLLPVPTALLEFLEHGLRYWLPTVRGPVVRGMPTAHSAPPLSSLIASQVMLVWPDPGGDGRGESLEPIYKTVPMAAALDPALYELLALVDALRSGRARERALSRNLLEERLLDASR